MRTSQVWRKSSYSSSENACVELSVALTQANIRDSKNPVGPVLAFPGLAVTNLVAAIRSGGLSE